MEPKTVRPAGKRETTAYAKAVLEREQGFKVTDIKYIGGGSFGFVYAASVSSAPGTVIMKACRTEGLARREAAELRFLGADTLVKVPEVYFTFDATEDLPMDFIGMERVDGTDCFTDFKKLLCSKKEKAAFADAVTEALHHWHSRTNEKFGLLGNAVYDGWLDFYRPFANDILITARRLAADGRLEGRVLTAMERAWDAFGFIFSEPVETASLIHGDMNVMNILSDSRLRPTAIIDPLETKWADKEYELFQLKNLTGDRFGLYETYKKKYPVSDKCDFKTAFYALYHEVYAYIISGNKVDFILKPLVRRMEKALDAARY